LGYQNRPRQSVTFVTIAVEKQTNAEWPYVGTLSFDQQKELMIVPEEDLISITSLGTAASVSVGSNTVSYSTLNTTGSTFTSTLRAGDHVYVNGANNGFIRVESVESDTQIRFVPKDALETVTGSESVFKAYPKNVVIPLSSRDNTTAAINGNFLNVDLDISMSATANVSVTFNQRYTGQSSVQKTTTRKAYVKIQANTHPNGVNGPWTLGHSDVFRLRAVYDGANTSGENITGDFFINHNQNFNFYGLSEIYQRSSSTRTIGENDEFLVEFDVFTDSDEGVKTINSYQMNDTLTLDELDSDGAAINIHEIPEVQIQDSYADLINAVDFRPKVVNTCILTTDYTLAPCNPPVASENTKFTTDGKKFPLPETDFLFDYEYYLPREDFVYVDKTGEFNFVIDGDDISTPTKEELLIYKVSIPPYPSFENDTSIFEFEEILNTRVTSGENFSVRINANRIDVEGIQAQTPGYTMRDIQSLEERIEALEYNQNLSLLEDRVKDTKISSSVDSTLERFKFGFFVENFMDEFFSDFRNQDYDASIYDGDLQPSFPLQS